MLKEKNEIVSWGRRYLRNIRAVRESGKKIYYLDETWINTGHVTPKVWSEETVTTARQAFVNGLSTGLKNPTGKGQRLIILHIGSGDGFVEGGLLLFQSKKTGDYHEEINIQVFEQWFENILPRLEENCVIVMDNASYHSRKIDKKPTSCMKKADIQSWLTKKNISFEEVMVKAELLTLVKESCHKNQYVIDEMARDCNRTVQSWYGHKLKEKWAEKIQPTKLQM